MRLATAEFKCLFAATAIACVIHPLRANDQSIVTEASIEKAATTCGTKISIEKFELPEHESGEIIPSIIITIFKDNSTKSRQCFRKLVPNVFSAPVERRSDAKVISKNDIDAILKECEWIEEDGKIEFFDDGSLMFRPNPKTKYEKVDCALSRIRTFQVPKFGFVGNEAYREGEEPQ